MDSIIVLAIIWFVFQAVIKSVGKKKAAEKKQQATGAQPAPQKQAPPPPKPRETNVWAQINDMLGDLSDEGASQSDESGCVGGSLPHETHEGAANAGSMPYIVPEPQKPTPAMPTVFAKRQESVQEQTHAYAFSDAVDLRRAVIMSEVLGKPVSMRPRRRAV